MIVGPIEVGFAHLTNKFTCFQESWTHGAQSLTMAVNVACGLMNVANFEEHRPISKNIYNRKYFDSSIRKVQSRSISLIIK
jgi:hypothetical protein